MADVLYSIGTGVVEEGGYGTFTATNYIMTGYDATLGAQVFWNASSLDLTGLQYNGPGPLTGISNIASGSMPTYLTGTFVFGEIKMNTPVLMRGYDGTLLAQVYWMANTIDSTGAEYTGPGPLTNIVVIKLMNQIGGGSGQPAYFYAIADAAISDGAPVYKKDDSTPGTPAVAEADATTEAMARVVGIASGSAADGGQVMVIVAGETNVPDAIWTGIPATTDVGKYVYLESLAGFLTLTAPTTSGHTVIKVGIVSRGGAGAVRINVQIGDGIILT